MSVFHARPCYVFILMYPFSSTYCSCTLSGSSLCKDANLVAGTASFEVGEEERGRNQPGSLEDVDSFPLRRTTCIFVLLALYYICIYRAIQDGACERIKR